MQHDISYSSILMLVETQPYQRQLECINCWTEHVVRCHHRRRHRTLYRGLQTLRGEAAFLI